MKRRYIILALIILTQCQTKVDNLNGHYISVYEFGDGRWETLEIVDSLILVNRIIMAVNERDTVVVDRSTNKIVTITPKSMFPIVDFKLNGDTIELRCEDDLGHYKIKFLKTTQTNPKYHFSNSYIDINLADYNEEERVSTNGLKIKNLTVGFLQEYFLKGKWSGVKDSVYIEFDNSILLQKDELQMLTKKLMESTDTKWILCLNLDKRIPESMSKEIKESLRKGIGALKIVEARNRNNEIVYLK